MFKRGYTKACYKAVEGRTSCFYKADRCVSLMFLALLSLETSRQNILFSLLKFHLFRVAHVSVQ